MNVALTGHFEDLIKRLIASGRYKNASEVVCAGLRQLEDIERKVFPPETLKHLYTNEKAARETKFARHLRIPTPDEV